MSVGSRWKKQSHQLRLHLKNFGCNVGDASEVHFRLYDAKDGVFFTLVAFSLLIILFHIERGIAKNLHW